MFSSAPLLLFSFFSSCFSVFFFFSASVFSCLFWRSSVPLFGEVHCLLFFLFSSRVPFFSAQKYFFSAQNVFASAQNTFLVQPKTFLIQPKILFQFSPKISPCLWFSASCFLFLFFLPFFSAFSHYVLPFFIPSVQLKTFFSYFMFLYLSKSSFSSNLK